MLKLLCFATAGWLSLMGTAHASDEGSGAAAANPSHGSDALVDKGEWRFEGCIPPGFEFGDITTDLILRPGVEYLDVQLSIALCSGECCQKGFRFHLFCKSEDGAFSELASPWYRNWATDGMITRTYEWAAPGLDRCERIDQMTVDWKCGWDGTLECLGEPSDPCAAS